MRGGKGCVLLLYSPNPVPILGVISLSSEGDFPLAFSYYGRELHTCIPSYLFVSFGLSQLYFSPHMFSVAPSDASFACIHNFPYLFLFPSSNQSFIHFPSLIPALLPVSFIFRRHSLHLFRFSPVIKASFISLR